MAEQLDYLFFSYGLGFILLAAMCLALARNKRLLLPWMWFGAFGLLQGLHLWLDMLAFRLPDPTVLRAASLCMMALSYLSLIEFGRLGTRSMTGKGPGRWATISLAVAAAAGWPFGWAVLHILCCHILALIGAGWAASAFALAARRSEEPIQRRPLFALSVIFGACALLYAVIPARVCLWPSSLVRYEAFVDTIGFYIQLLRGTLALASTLCIWHLLKSSERRSKPSYVSAFTALLLVILVAGWLFTDASGKEERQRQISDLHSTCRMLAASIDPSVVEGLGSLSDTANPGYRALKKQLLEIRQAKPEFRWIYLMAVRKSKIFCSADSEPVSSEDYSAPGDAYSDAPDALREVCRGERRTADAEYGDERGHFISAFAAIRDEATGRTVGALGVDRNTEAFQNSIERERLSAIVITLLAALLTVFFFIVYGLQKESLERVALSSEKLRESENRLGQVTSHSHTAIWEVDRQGLYTYVSDVSEQVFGYPPEEIIGRKHFYDLHPEEGREEFRAAALAVFESKEAFTGLENAIEWPDGSLHWVSTNGFAVLNEDGTLRGYRGSDTDITERKRAEEALRENEEKYRAVFSAEFDVIVLVDRETSAIVDINDAVERIYGYQREELIGQSIEVMSAEPDATVAAVSEAVRNIPIRYHRKKDGTVFPVEIMQSTTTLQNRAVVVAAIRDITERVEAEEAERRRARELDALLNGIPGHAFLKDADGTYVSVNEAFGVLTGVSAEQILGNTNADVFPPEVAEPFDAIDSRVLSGEVDCLEYEANLVENGRPVTKLTTLAARKDADGKVIGVIGVGIDITRWKQAESQIRLHSAAINAADDLIAILDTDGKIVFANDAFGRQTGYSLEEVLGRDLSLLLPQPRRRRSEHDVFNAVSLHIAWNGEMQCKASDGSSYTADVTVTPLPDDGGGSEHMIVIARNVTERKRYQSLLDYQVHHDALTDLPNRLLFSKELSKTITDHRRKHKRCAVLFIDLDNFKMVNDTMGHQAGDALLVEVAARLRLCLRDGDVLARMGGDEFTVLLRDISSPEDAAVIAQRILEQVSMPLLITGNRFVIGASIGISVCPDNESGVEGLLKAADSAMYKAKAFGCNTFQFFSEEISRANRARAETERDLRLAMEQNELTVYYQPIVDVRTMQVAGAEALIRWNHPEKGMIAPSVFVSIAEETGLVVEMGRMVLETACKQCRAWHDMGYTDFEMSVNVSPVQLRREGLLGDIVHAVTAAGILPHCLNLEITETALGSHLRGGIEMIGSLRELGFRTCLDDFGIGYSSLSRLKDFPIIHMKLDGSFIRNIEDSANDRAMTESIIVMAHNLGITVTAEWIENEDQMSTIRSLDCDYAQGYLISPALPADAFTDFLQTWYERAAWKKAA